ncbi:MAG: hypothetical protein H6631_15070 [Anaerolineaceae bacterium]|nr:hypothetical protein [Anaerolineaceae bacterium]
MAAFACIELSIGIKNPQQPSLPALATPDQAQGEEGRKLLELVTNIIDGWREQPPRGLSLPVKDNLEGNINLVSKNQVAIELLRAWREGDKSEQQETWDYLKQALEEDRLSNRKLFK